MSVDLQKVNLGSLWTILVGCVAGVVFAFSYFAKAEDVDKEFHDHEVAADLRFSAIELNAAYDSFYSRLDDYEESEAEGNDDLAAEHGRQMERLKAIICQHDPEWGRCNG